jgi:hypothetical protein
MNKKPDSIKMERTPAVVLDKTPEEKPDPSLCQCKDVQRRWDGDGIAEKVNGVTWYQCSACGKKYR